MLSLLKAQALWPVRRVDGGASKVPTVWSQWTFKDQDLADGATGRNAYIPTGGVVGAVVWDGDKPTFNSAPASTITFMPFLVDANEDFTVECKFNGSVITQNIGGMLLGVWSSTAADCSWALRINATSLKLGWTQRQADGSYKDIEGQTAIETNRDYHAAAVRRNGVITLYLDGKVEASGVEPAEFAASNAYMGTYQRPSVSGFQGKRWDFRVAKGALYTREFTPEPLMPVVPRSYTKEQQDNVVRQFTLTRGSLVDDIVGAAITRSSAYLVPINYGMISTTTGSGTSSYNFPVGAAFASGDFTIECKFIFTREQYGGLLSFMAQSGKWSLGVNNANKTAVFNVVMPDGSTQTLSAGIITPGRPYHLVAERVNGVISVYLDSVKGQSLEATHEISNAAVVSNGGTGVGTAWDMRIAKAAMYNGVVPKRSGLPKVRTVVETPNMNAAVLVSDPIVLERTLHQTYNYVIQVLVDDN